MSYRPMYGQCFYYIPTLVYRHDSRLQTEKLIRSDSDNQTISSYVGNKVLILQNTVLEEF